MKVKIKALIVLYNINCLNVIGIDRISNWPHIRPLDATPDATPDTGYPARLATEYLAVYTP